MDQIRAGIATGQSVRVTLLGSATLLGLIDGGSPDITHLPSA